MAYTLQELEKKVFDLTGRTTEEYDERLTPQAMLRHITDARNHIADISKCTAYNLFVDSLSAHQSLYNTASVNPRLKDIRWVGFATSGRPFKLTPTNNPSDIMSRGFMDVAKEGTPLYYTKSATSIMLFPSVLADSPNSLYLFARPYPNALYGPDDISDISEEADNMAVLRASIMLLSGRLSQEVYSQQTLNSLIMLWRNDYNPFLRRMQADSEAQMAAVSDPANLYLQAYNIR